MAEKRKVGRPKAVPPPAKRTRLSQQVKVESPKEPTPDSTVIEQGPKETLLPNKIHDNKPLPTVPEVQSLTLADDEYQNIAFSGILAASLARSRQKWLAGDFFERYYTKAPKKAAPMNNPSKSTMAQVPAGTGICTLIVEPMIFEARVYYVKDPSVIGAASAQHIANPQSYQAGSAYGSPYRPLGQQSTSHTSSQWTGQNQHGQTPSTPVAASAVNGMNRVALQTDRAHAHPPAAPPQPIPPAKQSPDPVIQLLASRASSDPALKDLMKIVATGNANQEQLRDFQRHIDELNAVVAKQNASNGASGASSPSTTVLPSRTNTPQSHTPIAPPPPRPAPPPAPRQRTVIPPPYPLVLEFLNLGASADRFLFPRHAIIEPLGTYSILASFLVFRKGSDAADSSLFAPDTEYFEPITVKIDVEPNQVDLLGYFKRSVKPPEEVRTWMEEQMRTKKRAEIRFLPLRLPHQSQIVETEEEREEPAPAVVPMKRGPYKKKEKEEVAVPSPPPPGVVESPVDGRRRSIKRSTRFREIAV